MDSSNALGKLIGPKPGTDKLFIFDTNKINSCQFLIGFSLPEEQDRTNWNDAAGPFSKEAFSASPSVARRAEALSTQLTAMERPGRKTPSHPQGVASCTLDAGPAPPTPNAAKIRGQGASPVLAVSEICLESGEFAPKNTEKRRDLPESRGRTGKFASSG